MRVLITGCNGQVGHCLKEQLTGQVELLAVDKSTLDISDRSSVFTLVSQFNPDFIINAAAYTAVDKSEEEVDLAYAVNCNGPTFLSEAAKSINATILHISTDYIFPGNKVGEYTEQDLTGPLGIYGKSKLAGELALAKENDKHIILRTAWVFGEYGNNFVKTMLSLGQNREALSIVGDQFGGPTYAGDIAKALIKIMVQLNTDNDHSQYGIYHFSGEPHVSWFEFAQSIFSQADKKKLFLVPKLTSITTDMYPTAAVRPENSKMNCTKINRVFDIEPSDWRRALNNIEAYVGTR